MRTLKYYYKALTTEPNNLVRSKYYTCINKIRHTLTSKTIIFTKYFTNIKTTLPQPQIFSKKNNSNNNKIQTFQKKTFTEKHETKTVYMQVNMHSDLY